MAEESKKDKRTIGSLENIPWDGSMEIRASDNSEMGVAYLGNVGDGAIPTGKTRDNARRFVALWNAAEELNISTEAVKEGALQKAFKSCDTADTAFATINICDNLTPQAKQALKEGWAAVQEALIALKPDSAYAEAVKDQPNSAFNLVKKDKEQQKVYIHLFHGRKTPGENLEDWGEQGPVLGPYTFMHTTYACDIRMGKEDGDTDDLSIIGDLVYYDGMYYGDWTIFSGVEFAKDGGNSLAALRQDYNESKATVPKQ